MIMDVSVSGAKGPPPGVWTRGGIGLLGLVALMAFAGVTDIGS